MKTLRPFLRAARLFQFRKANRKKTFRSQRAPTGVKSRPSLWGGFSWTRFGWASSAASEPTSKSYSLTSSTSSTSTPSKYLSKMNSCSCWRSSLMPDEIWTFQCSETAGKSSRKKYNSRIIGWRSLSAPGSTVGWSLRTSQCTLSFTF